MPLPIIGKLELPVVGSVDAIAGKLLHQLDRQAMSIRVLTEAGFLRPMRPDTIAHMLLTLRAWGNTPAAGYIIAGLARADETAIIDEVGTLSFSDVNRRTDALANSLEAAGVGAGDNIGVMCRNHRGFIEAVVAISKLGGHTLLLNTGFAGPQLADVCEREGVQAIIHDAEFTALLKAAAKGRESFIGWVDKGDKVSQPTIEELIAEGSQAPRRPPKEPGRVVILTSGTTGTPKGAGRHQPKNLDPGVSLLSVIPLKSRETTFIAAPLFHSWGFAHFTLGMLLSSTFLLRRRFDPEDTLATIEKYRPTALAVVPVMLQRIMELPEAVRHKYDTASLRVVAVSGSALPGELATTFMDDFGDILYNLYGSTEVAWATIATPKDLRQAPGTAGKPPWNTTVRLFDQNNELVDGDNQTGRIFVASGFEFEGYTGGVESKAQIGGLMSTGDVGYFDHGGRLFVEGRDDEMIVSGGENVFPREIEDLIASRKEVSEVAVVGVKDKEFGQRLKAYVVLADGAKLSESEVKDFVKSNTARFKVPREVEFIKELPRNTTGKVLKRELVDLESQNGAPAKAKPAGKSTTGRRKAAAPKTPTTP
ncbi:MAG: AMP-binding protein [Candidatus Dormiibacterota bacterium]